MDGRRDEQQPNTCAPSSANATSPVNPGASIATAALSQICLVDGRDLEADMVADGHAWAFVRNSRDYVDEEHEAAAVRAGIHGHTCQPAWLWRAERR